ncbi:MAG: YaiO family outer membrane beta-barrel protein [Gemmatimonadetes bacterium]|nr:YaiO family outer membrane beta-barrel protein [Gemmatimonadota bacterium]
MWRPTLRPEAPRRPVWAALAVGLLVTASVVLGPASAPAAGQATSDLGSEEVVDWKWTSGASWGREVMDGDRPGWPDWSAARVFASRRFERGTLGAELSRVQRFGLTDVEVGVDGYHELWSGAYGHVRLRVASDAMVLPDLDARVEVFQALAGVWELSANARTMDFPSEDVDVFGAGAARYVGPWYLRQVVSVARLAGASAVSGAFLARRFIAPPQEYVEVSGGVGSEVVLVGEGPTLDTRDTRFIQVRIQRFLLARWGVVAGLGYTTFEGAPSRIPISVGVIARH